MRSVDAVHKDTEVHAAKLCNRIELRPRHSAVIKPLQDTEGIIEPHILSENGRSCDNRPVDLERVIVDRTLATCLAADGSVTVQIANPSSESLALNAKLEIGKLSSVAVLSPAQLHVHVVPATPNTPGPKLQQRVLKLLRHDLQNLYTLLSPLNSCQSSWIYLQNTVLSYRYRERSWVSAILPKQRVPFPLILSLCAVARIELTRALKPLSTSVFRICSTTRLYNRRAL